MSFRKLEGEELAAMMRSDLNGKPIRLDGQVGRISVKQNIKSVILPASMDVKPLTGELAARLEWEAEPASETATAEDHDATEAEAMEIWNRAQGKKHADRFRAQQAAKAADTGPSRDERVQQLRAAGKAARGGRNASKQQSDGTPGGDTATDARRKQLRAAGAAARG